MIAADTSSIVAFLQGDAGDDTDIIQSALDHQQLVLPPVVLTEIDLEPGFWERAGVLRAAVLKQKKKARVADALIAQSCLDQSTPLVTRDRDFRHFARAAGLPLL